MGRIIAIDYGTKRVGLAVTDTLQIISTALQTIHSNEVVDFLVKYSSQEKVDTIVVGLPVQMDGQPSDIETHIQIFLKKLKVQLPAIPIIRYDERYTTKMAIQTMIDAGYKKKDRREKKHLDSISATLILQSYLLSIQ